MSSNIEIVDSIRRMRARGRVYKDIAAVYNLPVEKIRDFCVNPIYQSNESPSELSHQPSKKNLDLARQAIDLWDDGYTYQEIADILGFRDGARASYHVWRSNAAIRIRSKRTLENSSAELDRVKVALNQALEIIDQIQS